MEGRHAERGIWPVRYDRHVLQHQQEIRPSVPTFQTVDTDTPTAGIENEDGEED